VAVRRRRATSRSRGPKNQVWTNVVFEDTTVGTTVVQEVITEPADWAPVANVSERATLLRIRGWIAVSKLATGITGGQLFLAIYVADEDDVARAPNDATLYSDEDVLWTHGVAFGRTDAEPNMLGITVPVDVKAMRKMTFGRTVRLVMISSITTTTLLVGGVLRGLVRKGGN